MAKNGGDKHKDKSRTATKAAPSDASGADAPTRAQLIAGLNEDLSWEFNAIISYRLFASLCSGPFRNELRQFFEAEIPDELGHAQFLADKIVALGGTPTAEPAPVEVTRDNRRMFEIALAAERDAIRRYDQRAKQAEALGETALKVRLEDLVVDETGHAEEIDRILTNWKS